MKLNKMEPVVQQEITGCGIASAAAIAGISYDKAKQVANSIGIYADNSMLWSDSSYICRLLIALGIKTSDEKKHFNSWQSLPKCALLATKWHKEKEKAFWHWAVFVRDNSGEYVLDSKKSLKTNKRTDFGRIKVKWYIEVSS